MKGNRPIVAIVILLFLASFAGADITWYWYIAPAERGSVQTHGTLVDGDAPPGRYTTDVATFSVETSKLAGNIGRPYTESQPEQGFEWNGTNVTQFWRASGTYTNGANYFRDDWIFVYMFSTNSVSLRDSEYNVEAQGPLCFSPIRGASNIEIIAYSNGRISWTSDVARAPFHIEWSSDLGAGFTSDWSRLQLIAGTNQTMSTDVPMFYRVVSP